MKIGALALLLSTTYAEFCDFKQIKWLFYSKSDCKLDDFDMEAYEMAESAYADVLKHINQCYNIDGNHVKADCTNE